MWEKDYLSIRCLKGVVVYSIENRTEPLHARHCIYAAMEGLGGNRFLDKQLRCSSRLPEGGDWCQATKKCYQKPVEYCPYCPNLDRQNPKPCWVYRYNRLAVSCGTGRAVAVLEDSKPEWECLQYEADEETATATANSSAPANTSVPASTSAASAPPPTANASTASVPVSTALARWTAGWVGAACSSVASVIVAFLVWYIKTRGPSLPFGGRNRVLKAAMKVECRCGVDGWTTRIFSQKDSAF
jgi:hypothetical protein